MPRSSSGMMSGAMPCTMGLGGWRKMMGIRFLRGLHRLILPLRRRRFRFRRWTT